MVLNELNIYTENKACHLILLELEEASKINLQYESFVLSGTKDQMSQVRNSINLDWGVGGGSEF